MINNDKNGKIDETGPNKGMTKSIGNQIREITPPKVVEDAEDGELTPRMMKENNLKTPKKNEFQEADTTNTLNLLE